MTHDLEGARGTVEDPDAVLRAVAGWAAERHAEALVANARSVIGRDHLESAALHAERAKANGMMTTRSLGMETLLYLSGHRQVADAIAAAGIRHGTRALAVVVFGDARAADLVDAMGWRRDPEALESGSKDPQVLGLTQAELATVPRERWPDLALERVALLDVEK